MLATLQDQNGNIVRTEDLLAKGKKIILYTYPKDNTSGCTADACSIRDGYGRLEAEGYIVIGISKDSDKSHTGFIARHGLPFTLLADTETTLLRSLGAWGEKKLYGKVSYGTLRRTFIFSEDGILERIIDKVDTGNAVEQILG